jgi:hypothetical protein
MKEWTATGGYKVKQQDLDAIALHQSASIKRQHSTRADAI